MKFLHPSCIWIFFKRCALWLWGGSGCAFDTQKTWKSQRGLMWHGLRAIILKVFAWRKFPVFNSAAQSRPSGKVSAKLPDKQVVLVSPVNVRHVANLVEVKRRQWLRRLVDVFGREIVWSNSSWNVFHFCCKSERNKPIFGFWVENKH